MYKKSARGVSSLRKIGFQEISRLENKNQLIMVNRIKINAMLTEIALSESKVTQEQLKILEKASKQIRMQEKNRRCAIMGAKIKVTDVLKLFQDEEEDFQCNTFALVD